MWKTSLFMCEKRKERKKKKECDNKNLKQRRHMLMSQVKCSWCSHHNRYLCLEFQDYDEKYSQNKIKNIKFMYNLTMSNTGHY